jgi:hypothetical protein
MSLSAARSILAVPEDESSWDCIRGERDSFIWTDDDEPIRTWNEIAAKSRLPATGHRIDSSAEDEREFLTYKGRTVEVPLTHSRDDGLIVLHTLARLVRQHSDIRFCVDSGHSSNLAFLALAPAAWKALEKEFGRKAVAYRFLPFPEDLGEFLDQAFSEENNREYREPERSLVEEKMAQELADYVSSLAKTCCPSVDVSCELQLVAARVLSLKIKTKTDAERDALSGDRKRVKQIVDMAQMRCAEHEITLSMAYIQSHESVTRDFAGNWEWGLFAGFNMLKSAQ